MGPKRDETHETQISTGMSEFVDIYASYHNKIENYYMHSQNRENKIESLSSLNQFTKLTEEAFKLPIEIPDIKADRDQFLIKLYEQKPDYDNNSLYHEQIQKLASILEKITREFKEICAENLSKITAFPNYLKELIAANPDTIPYSNIKQTLEKIVYLLQLKSNQDETTIRNRFKEKNIELTPEELKVQFDLETKAANYIELRKENALSNLLPSLLVCDTGIAGHLDFALEYLSGGDSLEDIWCELRTKYVTDFGFQHIKKHNVRPGAEIHVPVVLRNHALKQNWGIRSELKNVEDHFYKETLITPNILKQFEIGFYDFYQLRRMTDSLAHKFEELFFHNYSRKYKGKEFISDEKTNKENRYDWIKITNSRIFSCAEEILKKWNIHESGTQVFEKKDEDGLRYSPLRFKHFFWQSCRKSGQFINKNSWIKEKFAENYHSIRSNIPSLANIAWIENNEGEIVSFDNLSPHEKMQYFIYSIIQYNTPDKYQWLTPSLHLFDIFKEKNDFIQLAKAMKESNQWEKHQSLLIEILHEKPNYFVTMLSAIENSSTQAYLLELAGLPYYWLHPKEKLHEPMLNLITVEDKASQWMNDQLKQQQIKLENFQKEYKLDYETVPISYSSLLTIAQNAKPDDQAIFKMYLQRYFPKNYFKIIAEEKPDYAKEFLIAHQNNIKQLSPVGKQLRRFIQEGDLKALQAMKPTLLDIYAHIEWMHLCQHSHLLKYFYHQELIACMEQRSSFQAPLLFWVITFNQSKQENQQIEALLESKELNINKACENGETPLHAAAIYGLTHWVKFLLKKPSINIDAGSNSNKTPLMLAAINGHFHIARLLIEGGANIKLVTNMGFSALHFAIQNAQLDVVRLLFENGAQINAPTNNDLTPLIIATQNGYLDIVYFLLENGAHANLFTTNGTTPLYIASENGYDDIVRVLLKKGADINASTHLGEHALHVAASKGHYQIVRILLENGAQPNATRNDKATALYLASASGHIEIVRLLLANGAHIILALANDSTPHPLFIAAKNGHFEIVKLLLHARGEDPNLLIASQDAYEATQNVNIKQLIAAGIAKFKNRVALHADRIFENHKIMRANAIGLPGAWIEDKKGEITYFETLPVAEKMKYFIHSTIHSGFPDRFQWLTPSPNLFDVFKEKNHYIMLAQALEADGQWDKHTLLLTTILYERPHHFLEILAAIKDETIRLKILDVVNIDLHWLHPSDEYHRAMINLPMNSADEKIGLWLATQLNQRRENVDKFKFRHKLDPNEMPILFSSLVKIAKHAKPEDENIFKLYFRQYFPDIYQCAEKKLKPNYAREFLRTDLATEPAKHNISFDVINGNLKALQEKKIEIPSVYPHIRLMHKSQHQHLKNYYYHLAKKACEEKRSPYQAPLLFWMVAFNQHEKENKEIEALLSVKDLNVNEGCSDDETPLHIAASYGLISWINILLDKKANVNAITDKKLTPLHNAVRGGHINAVRLLVERGAQLNALDSDKVPPLAIAVRDDHIHITRYLLEKGAKPNLTTRWNTTSLYRAALNGHLEVVKILLQSGADPTIGNKDQKPYHVATNPYIKQLLLIAELKLDMKKLLSSEAKESTGTFFSSMNIGFLKGAQVLLSFLEGNVSKADFDKLKLDKILSKAPWDDYYKKTLNILTMMKKSPPGTREELTLQLR